MLSANWGRPAQMLAKRNPPEHAGLTLDSIQFPKPYGVRIKHVLCAEFSKYPEYEATPSEITLEMIAGLSEKEVLRMPNMGVSSLMVLKEELRKYNYYLR